MYDWLKSNIITIVVIAVTVGGNYLVNTALYGYRLNAVEDRQDRQGVTIQAMQLQVTALSNDIASIKSKIDGISNNVDYIRNRIDRITQ